MLESLVRYFGDERVLPTSDRGSILSMLHRYCRCIVYCFEIHNILTSCTTCVYRFDFSMARAALLVSLPGEYALSPAPPLGLKGLEALLDREVFPARYKYSRMLAQSSSIGSVDGPRTRFLPDFHRALSAGRMQPVAAAAGGSNSIGGGGDAVTVGGQELEHLQLLGCGDLRIVWPTRKQVRGSLQGWAAGWGLDCTGGQQPASG